VFNEYVIGGIAAGFLATGGWGYWQKQRADVLEANVVTLEAELRTCGARLSNVLEDMESDREVDAMPDADLRNVPDHWLLDF